MPYLVQSEDQVPGLATWYASTCTECASGCGLHVRDPRGPRGEARGQPRAPDQPGQAVLPRPGGAPGAVQPRADPRADAARRRRQLHGDHLGRRDRPARRQGQARPERQIAVISRRGRGHLLRSPGRVDRGARRAAGPLRDRSITSRMRAANRQVFGLDQMPALRFRPRRSTSSPSAPTSWRPGARSVENQLGFAESHGFDEGGRRPSSSTPARAVDLTGLNADEWLPITPGSETALALAMADVLVSERGGTHGLASALSAYTPAVAREGDRPAGRDGSTRLAREFAAASPSLAVAGGIGLAARGGHRAVRRGQRPQLRRRQRRRDGALRRRARPWPTATPRWPTLAQAMDARRGRGRCWCTRPTRSTPLPKPAEFAEALRQGAASRSPPRMYLDETAAALRPAAAAAITRSSGGTTSSPAPASTG